MSDVPTGGSAYVLEKTYSAQGHSSLFFVYSRREHIRALLRHMFVDHPDPEVIEGVATLHFDGEESADLWLVEHGRRTGHVDLRPFITWEPHEGGDAHEDGVDIDWGEGRVVIDWAAFDAAVPASLAGPPLRHGEELRLPDPAEDFRDTSSELAALYPEHTVRYGMQVWVDGEMSDQPYEVFTDPDPRPDQAQRS